jgi:hypothetical protein
VPKITEEPKPILEKEEPAIPAKIESFKLEKFFAPMKRDPSK